MVRCDVLLQSLPVAWPMVATTTSSLSVVAQVATLLYVTDTM